MTTNIPPFYVGQEVEAVRGHRFYKIGDKFKVTSVFKRKCGCGYDITIGITFPTSFDSVCWFCRDEESFQSNSEIPFGTRDFRAIAPKFESITLSEILELETPLISQS